MVNRKIDYGPMGTACKILGSRQNIMPVSSRQPSWRTIFGLAVISSISLPSYAFANAPSFFVIGTSAFVFLSIPITIAFEAFAVRYIFSLGWQKSLAISSVNYVLSTIIGTLIWGALSFLTLLILMGASNVLAVSYEIIIFSIINTLVESISLALIFKLRIKFKGLLLFFLANLLTTALIFFPSYFYESF